MCLSNPALPIHRALSVADDGRCYTARSYSPDIVEICETAFYCNQNSTANDERG